MKIMNKSCSELNISWFEFYYIWAAGINLRIFHHCTEERKLKFFCLTGCGKGMWQWVRHSFLLPEAGGKVKSFSCTGQDLFIHCRAMLISCILGKCTILGVQGHASLDKLCKYDL